MTKYNKIILIVIFWLSFTTYELFALEYRDKYATVLHHYSKNAEDSLKYKAAEFLIDNMGGHYSPEGNQIEIFKSMIATIDSKQGIKELNQAWNNASKEGKVFFVPDSTVVTDSMLISNIDEAFSAWLSAPWHSEVEFELFCKYILPYRCSSEHIGGNWRKALSIAYGTLIEKEENMAKAFAIIKKAVFNDVILSNAYCPYALDAITCRNIGKAECGQRCILLVDVLRALGIPAAIDFIPMWADYSNKSHGWVSIIDKDGKTYTVFENDSIAKSMNPIDASIFIPRYNVKADDKCPYLIKTTKTPIKIYREEFSHNHNSTFPTNIFFRDVSEKYGLNASIILNADNNNDVMLCAYLSARDWMPIAKQKSINGKVVFKNVGKNAVYSAYIEKNGKRTYITNPFLVGEHGIERKFDISNNDREQICINRKYPLCQYIVDLWGYMRGGCFLGANRLDFADADTLALLTSMPYGMTEAKCHTNKKYRFLRYNAPNNNRTSLSELQFFINDNTGIKKIDGIYSAEGVDENHLEYLKDDNTATYCRSFNTGYTITMDVGEGNASKVDFIKYAPSTDLNFVEKGHIYELYYFDLSWHLIGRKVASEESLTFNDVPKGALLLLKDKTAGQEERIFEYINGCQIWH